jgi:hypothetical protein
MKPAAALLAVIIAAFSASPALCAQAPAGAPAPEDEAPDYLKTIPPEILRLYDPGLLDGSRPKLVAITQEMIWSLRSRPDQGGDVYTLDMTPSEVSTVQRNVLLEWIKAGHNVLISGDECAVYWRLFPGFTEPKEANNFPGPIPVTLSEHPANTDCANVTFYTETEDEVRRTNGTYGTGYNHLFFPDMPESAVVVASVDHGRYDSDPGGAVAGCIPYGQGGVYFITKPPQGSDTDRWTLNFRQWMLGLPIPGAAETGVSQVDDDADSGCQAALEDVASSTSGDGGSKVAAASGDAEASSPSASPVDRKAPSCSTSPAAPASSSAGA